MAKLPSSAIGLDIGRHALKAVLLRKNSGGFVLADYAIHRHARPIETADKLSEQIALLKKKFSASAQTYVSTATAQNAILRIFQHKEVEKGKSLIAAIRGKGATYFNEEDPSHYVIDTVPLSAPKSGTTNFLLAGMKKPLIATIAEALQKTKTPVGVLQVTPVSCFNAFESALPKTFSEGAFILLDIGHLSSSIISGVKGEMVALKSTDYGGKSLFEAFGNGTDQASIEQVLSLLENGDVNALETARASMRKLLRELTTMVNDVESRYDETVSAVFVSGMSTTSAALRTLISAELHERKCNQWDPFTSFTISLPGSRKEAFHEDRYALHTACGAAATALRGK